MNTTTPKPDSNWTLGQSKDWLRQQVRKGAPCPCCTQLAKVYKRKLNSGMAYFLIRLYRVRKFEPTHINDFIGEQKLSASSVGGVLLHQWGLIEEVPADAIPPQEGARSNGYYRVTEKGERFVLGVERVPAYVTLYNNRLLPNDTDETTSIYESLGSKFSYSELMSS